MKTLLFLVVLSGEDKITLKDNVVHKTGFFLTELMVPLQKLVNNGYTPVFVTPNGTKPVMDAVSDSDFWFGGNQKEYQHYRQRCVELGLCGDGTVGTLKTQSFSQVIESGFDQYAAVFFPGGHAPMEDLYRNKALGQILKHFHENKKPTALICHAPISLLSTLDNPEAFGRAVEEQDQDRITKLRQGWIYNGYRMTTFSTKEEKQEEPGGSDNALGGFVRFYPDEALDFAGGHVLVRAQKWQSNVVKDRELITGQNPFSDKEFANVLLGAMNERRHK